MKFTREQLSVISAPNRHVIVNASAGTGKTATLIGKANKVMSMESPLTVIFTLTVAAAEEIKSRLKIKPTFTGTIHSFAIRELNIIKDKGLYSHTFMTEKKVRDLLLTSYIHFYPINRSYKKELNEIYEFLMNKEFQVDRAKVSKFNRVIKKYELLKKERGLYDYHDAPEYLLKVLNKTGYKLPYKNLLVDEIQDIDEIEFNLINKFGGDVFLIGDPQQTIFQFRNSFSHVFDKFEELGYNLFILTRNFRSYKEILKYAGSYLTPERGSGGSVFESGALLRDNPKSIILCRYNMEVDILSTMFENVSTIHKYKGLEEDDIVVIDFEVKSEEDKNIMFVAKTRARNRIDKISLETAIKIGREIKYGLK